MIPCRYYWWAPAERQQDTVGTRSPFRQYWWDPAGRQLKTVGTRNPCQHYWWDPKGRQLDTVGTGSPFRHYWWDPAGRQLNTVGTRIPTLDITGGIRWETAQCSRYQEAPSTLMARSGGETARYDRYQCSFRRCQRASQTYIDISFINNLLFLLKPEFVLCKVGW